MNKIKVLLSIVLGLFLFLLVACGNPNLEAAEAVDAAILEIPEVVTLEDEDVILDARALYNALEEAAKELVENLDKLEAAEEDYNNLFQANEFDLKVGGIPEAVSIGHKKIIEDAREFYNGLTAKQKELTKKYNVFVILEGKLAAAIASNEVINLISELPTTITLEDGAKIAEARAAYNGLSAAEKALVLNYDVLEDAEALYQELLDVEADKAAAADVDALILALPAEVTLEDALVIREAEAAYNDLTADQKVLVENDDDLFLKIFQLTSLENAKKREDDMAAAEEVDLLIAALPEIVLLEDAEDITAARAAYDALTADQKLYVTKVDELVTKEGILHNLTLAKVVEDAIAELPAVVTAEDEDAIVAARGLYDALPYEAKSLVSNHDLLVQKENELVMILDPEGGLIIIATKDLPSQIISNYELPTAEGEIAWSFKAGEEVDGYNIATGVMSKNYFEYKPATLVATKGAKEVEFVINFGLLEEDQLPIFYTGTVKPDEGKTADGFGTYETQLDKAGFGGVIIVVGEKAYFLSKNSYIPLEGTEENELKVREDLRPNGLDTQADVNNTGLVKGVGTGYKGAGALYHNVGEVAVTFDLSDTYGRGNVPSLGFGKMKFKAVEGNIVVDPVYPEHSAGDDKGSTDKLIVTLYPGEFIWAPHSWEVDYSQVGYGTNLNQNFDGVLAPGTIIDVKFFEFFEED